MDGRIRLPVQRMNLVLASSIDSCRASATSLQVTGVGLRKHSLHHGEGTTLFSETKANHTGLIEGHEGFGLDNLDLCVGFPHRCDETSVGRHSGRLVRSAVLAAAKTNRTLPNSAPSPSKLRPRSDTSDITENKRVGVRHSGIRVLSMTFHQVVVNRPTLTDVITH